MEQSGGLPEGLGAHVLLLAHVAADGVLHRIVKHILDGLLQVLPVQHLPALLVDDLTLGVHYVIILKHILTGLEVPGLHLLLGILNGVGEHLLLDGGILVHAQLLHHAHDPLRAEQTHDVVLQGQVEAALTGIALTASTTAQLVINPAGLVALGAQDEQAAHFTYLLRLFLNLAFILGLGVGEHLAGVQDLLVVGLGVAGGLGDQLIGHASLTQVSLGQILGVTAQHDIGTTAGHVGGHGDRAQLTGLSHDLSFLLVVLCVQDVMLDALALEHVGQLLRLLNGHGAHQDRLALLVALLDLAHHRPQLARLGLVHHVVVVNALHGLVGGDLHDVQLVDGAELFLLGHSGTGHAGELVIEAEVVLEGDGSQGLGLVGHLHVLLGLDGLVQALVIPAAEHQAAGELVHDDDLSVLDHVVDVPLHHAVSLDGLVNVVRQGGILGVGQILNVEGLLGLLDAPGGEGSGAGLLVHDIVRIDVDVLFLLVVHLGNTLAGELGDELIHHSIELGGLLALAGDDQGGTGLIDEDGVHLVHDGKGVAPLDQLLGVDGHVIPQVVKAELVVGSVGDVGVVSRLLGRTHHPVDHQAHGQTHEAVDLAHPLGVTLGQVVVDGDDVHALAGQRVQVGGQGGHQGLAFAGLHLGDAALMQDDAADELHPVGAHAQHTPGGLPAGGKGLGQDVVQSLAILQTLLELRGLSLELLVGEGLVLILQSLDLLHQGHNCLDLSLRAGAENFLQETHIRSHLVVVTRRSFRPGKTSGHTIVSVYHKVSAEKRANCKLSLAELPISCLYPPRIPPHVYKCTPGVDSCPRLWYRIIHK